MKKNTSQVALAVLLLIITAPASFAEPSWTSSPFPTPPAAARPAPLHNLSSISRSAETAPTGYGTLVCNCDPAGAEVRLNGTSMGEAPFRREHITAGDYTLTFSCPGYENSVEKITIKKDVTLTIEENMAVARGSIKLDSAPEGAEALLDGKDAGVTPVTLAHVSGGKHMISLAKDYFEPLKRSVTMPVGANKAINARLKRRLLLINIDGTGDGMALAALGRLDGVDIIPTPLNKLKEILCARELDPASLEFMVCTKKKLDLEDSAVMSSLLEQERAELALAISEKRDGNGRVVSFSLYCSRSAVPDVISIPRKDDGELEAGIDRFVSQWQAEDAGGSAGEAKRAPAAVNEAAPEDPDYLFNLALVLVSEKLAPDSGEMITLGNAYFRDGEYGKALKAYQEVKPDAKSGVCRGTALYRMAEVYEKMGLWTQAASSYRELCLLYPDATLISQSGPKAAPLARKRLEALYKLGLVKERWWL